MRNQPIASRVERKISLEMICPYEPGKPIEEVKRELGLERVIKLASNENFLGPSPRVIETLNRSDLELHMYPDYDGWYLRRALAEHLTLPLEQIILGAGSAELMRLVGDAFLGPGDEAILADITFPVYLNVILVAGATPVVVPLDDQLRWDVERVLEAVTPRTKVIFLASPNNPTGRRVSPADLAALVDRLPPRVLCVLDLAYWEYIAAASPGEGDPLALVRRHGNVLLLRTFSKVFGLAGLRVGFALAHPELIEALGRVRIPFSTGTAAQVAARVALADSDHVARSVALNTASRAQLAAGLDALAISYVPSEANFVLADCGVDSEDLFQRLMRRGIIVRPVRHPRLQRRLRITTGTTEQMDALLAALRAELRA